MSEEKAQQQAEPKSSKGLSKIIVFVAVILVAAIAGLVTYKLVVAPMFAEGPQEPVEEVTDAIPATAVAYDFDEAQAAVKPDDPAASSSVLMYTVSFICANVQTQALIDKNKQWFVSKLSELHRNRTKSELNDPETEKEILKIALEESNSLLRRLQQPPDPEIRVIEVLHLKFAVFDL